MKNWFVVLACMACMIGIVVSCDQRTGYQQKERIIVGVQKGNMAVMTFEPVKVLSNYDTYIVDFDQDSIDDFKFACYNYKSNTYKLCFDRRIIDSYTTLDILNPSMELLYFPIVDTIYHCHLEYPDSYTEVIDYYYNNNTFTCSDSNISIFNVGNDLCPTMFQAGDTIGSYPNWTRNKFEFAHYKYDYEYRSRTQCPSNPLNSRRETSIINDNWNEQSIRYVIFRKKINDLYYLGWIKMEVSGYHVLKLYEIVYELENK